MSKPCLCVEYHVENQNNNQFSAIIFLDKNEAKKFQQSFDEDRRSPFRKIQVFIRDYDHNSVSAVVNKTFNITNQVYDELQQLNERSYIGQTNLYFQVNKELLNIIAPFAFTNPEELENEIVYDDINDFNEEVELVLSTKEESTEEEVEEEEEEDEDEEEEETENAKDSTIHDLVYANNFEDLASILATGEFSATGKDEQGVQPIYLLDTKPEQFQKAILILETLVSFGARLDRAGLGYDDEGQPQETWLLLEALKKNNYELAMALVQMGHPLVNDDLTKGYLFDIQEFWYNFVNMDTNMEMEMEM